MRVRTLAIGSVVALGLTAGAYKVAANWSNILEMGKPGPERVADARKRAEPALIALCKAKGLAYPPPRLYLRAFKAEASLEVWAVASKGKYVLLKSMPIAAMSGGPGPKRKEGDGQVPEGAYRIDRFNPESLFHLSLGLNYPNSSDRVRSDPEKPGGDIFIHGDARSIGCLAMTDEGIEPIYLLALGARKSVIPVHIFPARPGSKLDAAQRVANPALTAFWDELVPLYTAFEKTRTLPMVTVGKGGTYVVKA